jgi:putative DNA primase/helicase
MTVPSWVRDVAGVEVPPDVVSVQPRLFKCTEMGNAERLQHWHGDVLRYVHDLKAWLAWDGRRWAHDRGPRAQAHVVDVVRKIVDTELPLYAQLADVDDLTKLEKTLEDHARRSESSRAISACLRLAGNLLAVEVDELDQKPWLLPVSNGTIDLRRGVLRAHRREDYLTHCLDVAYDADAQCPTWEAFVWWFAREDEELVDYLQKLAGYWLTGSTREQQLAFFFGDGANGKTTYLETLRDLLGSYAVAAPPKLMVETRNEEHPTEVWTLRGRRLAVASESKEARKLNEEKIKRLTGSEALSAREMHGNFQNWVPTHKLVVALNHKPVITGTDHGIWRRVHLVPCDATIGDDERDDTLPAKLRRERAGILAWAVRGCLAWQEGGRLRPCARMRAAAESYRSTMDRLGMFLEEECVVDARERVTAKELYQRYRTWTLDRGERPKSQLTFGTEVGKRFERYKSGSVRGYCGLRLRHSC